MLMDAPLHCMRRARPPHRTLNSRQILASANGTGADARWQHGPQPRAACLAAAAAAPVAVHAPAPPAPLWPGYSTGTRDSHDADSMLPRVPSEHVQHGNTPGNHVHLHDPAHPLASLCPAPLLQQQQQTQQQQQHQQSQTQQQRLCCNDTSPLSHLELQHGAQQQLEQVAGQRPRPRRCTAAAARGDAEHVLLRIANTTQPSLLAQHLLSLLVEQQAAQASVLQPVMLCCASAASLHAALHAVALASAHAAAQPRPMQALLQPQLMLNAVRDSSSGHAGAGVYRLRLTWVSRPPAVADTAPQQVEQKQQQQQSKQQQLKQHSGAKLQQVAQQQLALQPQVGHEPLPLLICEASGSGMSHAHHALPLQQQQQQGIPCNGQPPSVSSSISSRHSNAGSSSSSSSGSSSSRSARPMSARDLSWAVSGRLRGGSLAGLACTSPAGVLLAVQAAVRARRQLLPSGLDLLLAVDEAPERGNDTRSDTSSWLSLWAVPCAAPVQSKRAGHLPEALHVSAADVLLQGQQQQQRGKQQQTQEQRGQQQQKQQQRGQQQQKWRHQQQRQHIHSAAASSTSAQLMRQQRGGCQGSVYNIAPAATRPPVRRRRLLNDAQLPPRQQQALDAMLEEAAAEAAAAAGMHVAKPPACLQAV